MTTIDTFVSTLENGTRELQNVRLSANQLRKLKQSLTALQEVIHKADRLNAMRFDVGPDTSISLSYDETPEPAVLEISSEGVELCAGERLSTLLKRKRGEKGMTFEEVSKILPISAEMYRRLEQGVDYELPDDVCKALADHMGMAIEDVRHMHELDKSNPIRPYYPY